MISTDFIDDNEQKMNSIYWRKWDKKRFAEKYVSVESVLYSDTDQPVENMAHVFLLIRFYWNDDITSSIYENYIL